MTTPRLKMGKGKITQFGFFIDLSRCTGCNACLVACKQWHDIQPGPIKWLRVYQWESGAFPDIELHTLPIMCFHCQSPICAKVCPHQAISKDEKYGAVLVDRSKCKGKRKCFKACPYGSPQFETDQPNEIMSKCTMCIDRLEKDLKPLCVLSCSLRALEFGPLEELRQKYGNLTLIPGVPETPSFAKLKPSVVFKPEDPKRQILPYDSEKALRLWQKRHSNDREVLPDIFENTIDVTQVSEKAVGRNKLVLKPKNIQELIFFTTDDE